MDLSTPEILTCPVFLKESKSHPTQEVIDQSIRSMQIAYMIPSGNISQIEAMCPSYLSQPWIETEEVAQRGKAYERKKVSCL